MRRMLALSVLAAAACALPAVAAPKVRMTLEPSTTTVLYGKTVTLSGRVVGKPRGTAVQILAWRYGRSAPDRVAVVHTGAGGRFVVHVRPRVQTRYLARDTVEVERAVVVRVEPALSIEELGDGRIHAHVAAGASLKGRHVELEQQRGGAWHVIAKAKLSRALNANFAPLPASRSGQVRLALSVNQAGAGYLGAVSHAMAYRAYTLTLQPSSYRVSYGHAITLSGRLWNGRAGEAIVVQAWAYRASAPRRIATVRTGPHGRWSLRVAPRRQTTYRAMWGTLHISGKERVGVAPEISLNRLTGQRVLTHVRLGRSLAGRTVKLQRLDAPGVWRTVAQKQLNRRSSAVFAVALPASQLRVALSVNEAGAGYLAGFSRTLRYQP